MANNKDISVIEKKVSPAVREAQELLIKDDKTVKIGVELLSKLNQLNDKIKEEKEKVTKPLREALRAETSRWKPVEDQNTEAIDIIRGKLSDYQTAEVKRQKEEEMAIARRVGEGKGKLKLETAVKKLGEVDRPNKEVATDTGLVQFRETKMLKIIDVGLIPREYMVVNEKKVLEALKAGVNVLGAELEIVQVPVNYR